MSEETPKKLPRLGKLLRFARRAREISQNDVAQQLSEIGIPFTQSRVAQIESGDMVNPTPELMRAIAQLYSLDYRDIVAVFVFERYGVNFSEDESSSIQKVLSSIFSQALE